MTCRPPTVVLSESSYHGLKSSLYKMTTDPIYRRLDTNTNLFSRTPVLFLKYPKVHVVIMKAFTFMSFGLALSAALGALANPVSPRSPTSNDLDVRNEENRRIKYKGVSL